MKKKCCRYFGGLLQSQERWLNRMAARGWRLTGAGKLSYEFEACAPGEYEYRVEFAAQMDYERSRDYKAFLEELGYEVFYKNVNLNWSVGKAVWRPWGQGAGQLSTSPGSFNKELMLVGRRADGSPFELYTAAEDKEDYARMLSHAFGYRAVFFLAMGLWLGVPGFVNRMPGSGPAAVRMAGSGILVLLGLWALWRGWRYRRQAKMYREEAGPGV